MNIVKLNQNEVSSVSGGNELIILGAILGLAMGAHEVFKKINIAAKNPRMIPNTATVFGKRFLLDDGIPDLIQTSNEVIYTGTLALYTAAGGIVGWTANKAKNFIKSFF